jgi:hypothetical protein
MKNSIIKMSCMMIMVFMLTACMGTTMAALWKDEAYHDHPAKVFVIGVLSERGPRSLVEDEMVRRLKERGTDAVVSYPVLTTTDPKPDKNAVLAMVKEAGADAIMVVRFLKKDTADANTPVLRYAAPSGFESSWGSYYGDMGTVSSVGVRDLSYDKYVISIETTLYQTESGKPIWSALSRTTYEQGPIKQIKPFAGAVIKELVNAKIIK